MTFSSERLNEKIRVLSETLQAALNAISYLLSQDASNVQALNEKVAEVDALKLELGSVDDGISASFDDVIELAKQVMVKASQATPPITIPTPNPVPENPVPTPLPTPENPFPTPENPDGTVPTPLKL